ncbi:unnamed protein product [Ectocarpus sp. 4 AP-2014]
MLSQSSCLKFEGCAACSSNPWKVVKGRQMCVPKHPPSTRGLWCCVLRRAEGGTSSYNAVHPHLLRYCRSFLENSRTYVHGASRRKNEETKYNRWRSCVGAV